jgi:uncharacterized protein
MPTEITVHGSYASFLPPERGTVHATISYEGSAMRTVYDRVASDLESVQASITPLRNTDDGPVTWWSAKQVRTWSNRPWNKDGRQLPLVHHASVDIEVKFRDFAALTRWVGEHVSATEGFRISHVEWALTEQRRDELLKEVRTRAVRDAATRAQQYADALGLGPVRPVAVADTGMLGVGGRPEGGGGVAFLRAAHAGPPAASAEVELVPEDIEVSATVDARFVVSDA